MIGDDIVSDVGGAQQCGMRAVQVRTGKYRSVHALHPVQHQVNHGKGEMTVGNDFCTFLFAELHGALNFHTIHSFLKEKEVWFGAWYTC